MNELEKLSEAKYFANRMKASINDPQDFQYELSAFLSSARSVLQYVYKGVKNNPDGILWYKAQISGNSVLKFFRDKRDVNIHVEPVKPSKNISMSITDHIGISESIRIEIKRKDGMPEIRKDKGKPPETEEIEPQVNIRYMFRDWNGPEDVLELSNKYLISLKKFVKEGINSGIISG